MKKEIKQKLEGIVDLLNDPDATVMENEVIDKLETIVKLLKEPKGIEMEKEKLTEKLEAVLELVNNVMVNPDIELEYYIPEALTTSDPYIQLKYAANGTHIMEQKLPLKSRHLNKTAEDVANLVTFYIEQFIEQIDSVEHGAQ